MNLDDFMPFIVIGLTAGSIYSLAALGLVLTYKTSGVFNFAHGAIAAVAAFVFYDLWQREGVPWGVSAVLCILVLGPVMGWLLELLTRALARVGTAYQVVGTVGLALGINGALTLWASNWSDNLAFLNFPAFLPTGTFTLFGVNVGYDQAITMGVALVSAIGLYLFFRYLRLGVAMRGVVDNPELVNLTGTNPTGVRRYAWVIGTVFAAMSGVLLGPVLGLNVLLLILLVVQAYGAAAIGYFSNLPLTYVGGLVIGVAAALSTKYIGDVSWLGGLPASLPFIVLFVALLVTPKAKLALRRPPPPPPPRVAYTAPARVSIPGAVIVVVLLAFVPDLVGTRLAAWTLGVMYIVLFLSLGLLVRTSGMISLCQLAFAAVGAATYGNLVTDHGVPWLFALLLAGLVTIPVGLIIAIPAIRLSGVFLALATLGFGIMLEHMFYTQDLLFGPLADGIKSPRPGFATSDHDYYLLVLAVAVVCSIAVVAIVRGRLGRLLRALADSPLALDTQGATTNVTRALVFGISAFFAGIFGALIAGFFGSISGASFPSFTSLTIIAVVVLSAGGAPWYALVAAIAFQVFPSYLADWLGIDNIAAYVQMFFGLGAVVFVGSISKRPPQMPPGLQRFLDRLGGRKRASAEQREAAVPAPAVAPVAARPPDHTGLEVEGITVRFGGLVAVDHLSLAAPVGRITGLIGPNGAGKTTTFNACSGLQKPSEGRVVLHGKNVTRLGPAARARRGMGRTFQRSELWPSLSVEENVALGLEASMAGAGALSQLVGKPGDRKRIEAAVDRALALTGVEQLRDRQVALLTTGERRLVELARCLAGPFDVMLLDEPSSGLDATETEQFGHVLTHVVAERGAGMLLVEHDMALVMEVCEHIYVMDFGELIFEGSPDEVRASPIVQAAYLGTEGELAPVRAGAEPAGVPDPATA